MTNTRRRGRLRRPHGGRLEWAVGLLLLLLIGGYVFVLDYSRPHVSGETLKLNTFFDLASKHRLKNARMLDVDAYIVGDHVTDSGSTRPYNVPYLKESRERVVGAVLDNDISTEVDQQSLKSVVILASYLLPTLILVLLFVYLIVSYRRGSGLFGIRSGAQRIVAEEGGVSFADVAGQEHAIAELREVTEFLSDPGRFAAVGARIPKGVLLFGPPGCGKTLLARALAGEAGASFFSISGSDFVEIYVGVGAARVRDLFKEAREHAPALIFIDELDSIGRARSTAGSGPSHGEQEQALNQILAEMDGFSTATGIIVIGATNRPDILDQALLRPGRFDRSIGLERPDESSRLAILQLHAKGKQLEPETDLAAIAVRAIGLTGADLANVMNESALLAARARRPSISQVELDQALERILEAPERQRRLSMRDRSIGRRVPAQERLTFADVAGSDDVIAELREVRDYLAAPDRFERMGVRMPHGILLVGPPGCGKTLLARAVAGEANAAFFSVASSEFVEVFVGEGASRVRELFAEAKAVAPAIVFLDEIDAIGGRRSTDGHAGHQEREQTLNQILVELDGFTSRSGILVMAATNRPDILDPALVRPGRFDRRVTVELPDRAGRLAILQLHAQGKRLAVQVDLEVVARLTPGLSGLTAPTSSTRRLPAKRLDRLHEALERLLTVHLSRRPRRAWLPSTSRRRHRRSSRGACGTAGAPRGW